MSIEQSTPFAPFPTFYGCSFERCTALVSLIPYQVIGFIPARPNKDDCRPEPCQTFKVFAGGARDKENDKNYFLFDFPTAAGNDYRAERYDYGSDTWIDVGPFDATTGTLFDFGVFQDYPKRSGICIDWDLVLNLYGVGLYRLALGSLFEPSVFIYSLPFSLCVWRCDLAHNTVRIETLFRGNTGNYLADEDEAAPQFFDLNTMDWNDQIRVTGSFRQIQTKIEESKYILSTFRTEQVKRAFVRRYDLTMNEVLKEVLLRFNEYGLSSKKIQISNYNTEDAQLLNFIDVVSDESTIDFENYRSPVLPIATVTLAGRYQSEFESC